MLSFVEHQRFQFHSNLLYVIRFVHLFVTVLFGYTTITLLTNPAMIPHQILHRPANQSLTHAKIQLSSKAFTFPEFLYTIAPSYLLYQPQKQNKTKNSLTVTLRTIKRQGTILPYFQNHPGIQSKFIKSMYHN